MVDLPPPRPRSSTDPRRRAHESAAARFFSADRTRAWQARYAARDDAQQPPAVRRARREAEAQRRRQVAVDRAREWNEAHPEQRRAQMKRWRDANRDRIREQGRAAYARNREAIAARGKDARDRDPEKYLQRSRDWHARNPGYATEYGRRYRQDPERYALQLQRNREAKRLRRRLQALGLPPHRVQRATAAARRANARDAEEFFTSEDRRIWHAQYAVFHDALDRMIAERGSSLRAIADARSDARARVGLPVPDREDVVYADAVALVLAERGRFDSLAGADVRRAVESVRELQARREVDAQRESLRAALVTYVRQHQVALRADAALENRARAQAGKSSAPVGVLAHRIAFDAVRDQLVLDRLAPADVAKAITRANESHPALFDDRPQQISADRTRAAPQPLIPRTSSSPGLAR